MQQDQYLSQAASFRNIGFSEKVQKVLDRALKHDITFGPASWKQAKPLLDLARLEMELAPDALISGLHAYNPDILRTACWSDGTVERKSLFCYLPLNEDGALAVAHGHFEGKSPRTDWICKSGEQPVAVYLWLVYMPGTLGHSIGVIAKAFEALAPHGCPVFSKAVNAHAERLNRSMGFLDARQFYPGCASDLLVIFPQKKAELARKTLSLKVAIARDLSDIMKVFAVRSATYVAEQFCHYDEEFDGNDFCATHFLGTVNGDAAGCIRMRFFSGFAKIERLAVRQEYRNSRLAFELARAAVRHCRLKGYTKIYGHSRLDLVRFWQMFGFKVREDGRDFGFANVRYVEILCEQPPLDQAMTLDAEPLVIIRPEGDWEAPGPLDISVSESDPARQAMMAKRIRTVRGQSVAR